MRCKICKTDVGCGCNLKDGMCAKCKSKQEVNTKPKENGVTKNNKLLRM